MLFLDDFSQFEANDLAQGPFQFCQIWKNWPRFKHLRGNIGYQSDVGIPSNLSEGFLNAFFEI